MKTQILLVFCAINCILFAQENEQIGLSDSTSHLENRSREIEYPDLNYYKLYKKHKVWNLKNSSNYTLTNTASLGPNNMGGRVRGLLVDRDRDIYLAAASGGGLWTFDPDYGETFQPVDDFGAFLHVTCIHQSELDGDKIWIGTGDRFHGVPGAGVFYSNDAGQSFQFIQGSDPEMINDFYYIDLVKTSPSNDNVIYVIAGENATNLYKSLDGGASWQKVYEGMNSYNSGIYSLDFLKNDKVIIGVRYSGLYTSTTGDSGTYNLLTNQIWNSTTLDYSEYGTCIAATCASNRDIVYAAMYSQNMDPQIKIYKSTDGGNTWEVKGSPQMSAIQSHFNYCLGVHPNLPDIVTVGAVSWAYSRDGADSWTVPCPMTYGYGLEVDFHTAHFHSSSNSIGYMGYDQGIGRFDFTQDTTFRCGSTDTGPRMVTEIKREELGKKGGFNTLQCDGGDFFPEEYGDSYFVGYQDGGCITVLNDQQTRVIVGDGRSVFVNKQNPNILLGSNGQIRRTTTGLAPRFYDFSQVAASITPTAGNFPTHFVGNDLDGDQIYTPGSKSIYRSVDAGATFTQITTTTIDNAKIAISRDLNPTLYVIGPNKNRNWDNDLVIIPNAKINNNATSITNVIDYQTEGRVVNVRVDVNDPNTIYVFTHHGKVFRISDLDGNYVKEDISGDISGLIFYVIETVPDHPDLLFAGTNIGLFVSYNGGVNWEYSSELPYTAIRDIKFRSSDSRMFFFSYGRGVWASTLDFPTSTEALTTIEIEVFPNPTTDALHINAQDLQNKEVLLYDINGSLVRSIKAESNAISMDVKDLATGAYLLQVISEDEMIFRKRIIKK